MAMHFPAYRLHSSLHRHIASPRPGWPARPFLARLVGMLVLVWLLLPITGCDRDVKPVATHQAARAQCVIQNQTDYAWRIVLQTDAGSRTELLKPRETRSVNVPAGDYAIAQTLLPADAGGSDDTRRFRMHFEPDRRYRWRLATLLSATATPEPP